MSAQLSNAVRPFRFVSYGVTVEITGNEQAMIDRGEATARRSLIGHLSAIDEPGSGEFDHIFELNRKKGGWYVMVQNGGRPSAGRSEKNLFKYFDSMIRVAVGEYAVDRVFLHAGVVAWKGKAIMMPGNSYQGKSTLVTELVKLGATYYSDEYAICDRDGLVYPYARPIGRRTDDGRHIPYFIDVETELNGTSGHEPIPVGMILLTAYEKGRRWRPKMLSPGNGVLQLIPFTLTISHNPDFSMRVLNKISQRAIIATGLRGSAEKFAKTLLDFVDKNAN